MKNNYLAWISYSTLARKELVRLFRIWIETILPPVITISLYFLIFGKLIGSQLHPIHGYSYMQYIMPGLIIMPVINNSYMNAGFSFFITKFSHSIEEILVSPMPNYAIIFGYLTGCIARCLVVSACIAIVGLCFTHIPVQHFFLAILIIIATAILFGLLGLINGIVARKFDDISLIPNFILTPLTYFGGVFYSVSQLPTFAQYITKINPIFYIVSSFKEAMLGISDVPMGYALSAIFSCIVVFYCLTIYLLRNSSGLRN